MGYSFVLLDVPPGVAALRERAQGYFRGNEAPKPFVQQYYAAIEPHSFHCNLAEIGLLKSTMRRLDMLAGGNSQPFPTYPRWDSGHYASETEHRLANPRVWAEYEVAENSAMRQRGTGPGIARFKFLSNGPWIVVAEEVSQALDSYDTLRDMQRQDVERDRLWSEWIDWLRTATAGFEVT